MPNDKPTPARSVEEIEARRLAALQADDAASTPDEQPDAPEPSAVLAGHIRQQSIASQVVSRRQLALTPPDGITKEQAAPLCQGEPQDIGEHVALVTGKKDDYYYDNSIMTTSYAVIAARLEDKDLLATVAETVRHECKTYPRPTRVSALMDSPYFFSEDEVLGAVARMRFTAGYEDIDTVEASNGKVCIYSSLHMSKPYARALCEEIEVERYLCQ